MKKILFFLLLCTFSFSFSQKKHTEKEEFFFYENRGQIVNQSGKENSDVKYLFHSAGLNVQLRKQGFSYDVYETKKQKNPYFSKDTANLIPEKPNFNADEFSYENLFHRIDIELLGSNADSKMIVEGKSKDYENYYNIAQKPKGITNVHRYRRITYKNIYNNIDLVFFKPKDSLKPIEYNFIVNPGGKISDIKMKFSGAETELKDNKLVMLMRFGKMEESIPHSWYQNTDAKEYLEVQFKNLGDQVFGFNSPVNTSDKTIVIDPVPTRIWGSYVGGAAGDYGSLKTDIQSTVYVYGATYSSTNIATSGTYQPNIAGQADAFLMKVTKFGQKLWGTYYGYNYNDQFLDVSFDENFNIYAGGLVERSFLGNNTNVVAVKFNNSGLLQFEKEFVSSRREEFQTISYNSDHVYLGGNTFSEDFPVFNAMQSTKATGLGLTDAFLASLNTTNGSVDWATYIGFADGSSGIYEIFESDTNLQIIGATRSVNFPMINAFQPVKLGINDGIYLVMPKNGSGFLRTSYFGNEGQERIFKAKINNGTLILGGEYSISAASVKPGIWRINLSNNTVSKTYFNFDMYIQPFAYPDTFGNVFFCGLHSNSNGQTIISTPGAYQETPTNFGTSFLIKINQNDVKEWGTYYQGNGATQLAEVTKDAENYIYLTGMSSGNSTGIATPGTFQQTMGGQNDIFIAKFQDCSSSGTVASNSPVCLTSNIQLNASGGTNYSWTGPNGFSSSLQNPIIPNATSANAGAYICQITGSNSCDGSFTVNVIVGDTLAPVPNVASLPNVTGNCNTVISIFPTAFDNCAGTITATTVDPLSYSTAGTYLIHWTYADGNGNTATQNQNVLISATAVPTAISLTQTFCATALPTIANIQVTGQNIKWYDTNNIVLQLTTPLVNGQTYFASQTVNGCESTQIPLLVTVNNTPKPTANLTQDFCASANPTVANLVVTGNGLNFYNAAGNVISLTTPLVQGQIYSVTQTLNSCESEKLNIAVTLSQNNVPANNYRASLCNNSTGNSMTVDLTQYQSNIIANPANYIFTYTDQTGNPVLNPSGYILNIGVNILNVKVSTADGCFKNVILELVLNPKPTVSLPEDFDFCKGKSVILDAGPGFSSYLWSTGATTQAIDVSTPGTFTVTVTNTFGCSNSESIQLTNSVLAEIVSVNISNSSATIILSAAGNYEYSLDNFSWQDSNIFSNLGMGEYIVYVRTKSGCIIGQKSFSIFNIPNAISPNEDGINDRWKIAGLENYSGSEISVFDRKGLLVFKQTISKKPLNWDAMSNGSPIPTGNYWYVIKVADGRNYTGWLLIKNRN